MRHRKAPGISSEHNAHGPGVQRSRSLLREQAIARSVARSLPWVDLPCTPHARQTRRGMVCRVSGLVRLYIAYLISRRADVVRDRSTKGQNMSVHVVTGFAGQAVSSSAHFPSL